MNTNQLIPVSGIEKTSESFRKKVIQIAQKLGADPNHLMAVMSFESGGTFSPSVLNQAGSGATGLIQFMPETAIGLGTSVEALANMTAEAQLDYVAKYFEPYKGQLNSLEDVYMAVLYPAAMGRGKDAVLFAAGTIAYQQNAGLDRSGDGNVTVGEATQAVRAVLEAGLGRPEPKRVASYQDHKTQQRTIQYGDRGEGVKQLQQTLNQRGTTLTIDGVFGTKTHQAVLAFQAQQGLNQDGVVGPQTWAALQSAPVRSTPQSTTASTVSAGTIKVEPLAMPQGNTYYGAPRSGGARQHAGVDVYNPTKNQSNETPQATLGGTIIRVGYDPGGYGHYIDIKNEKLNVVERIAEFSTPKFTSADVGKEIAAGTVVGVGAEQTSIIHREIRPFAQYQQGRDYGFEGTVNWADYMKGLGLYRQVGNDLVPTGRIISQQVGAIPQNTAAVSSPPAAKPVLHLGSVGGSVAQMQQALKLIVDENLPVDGIFGLQTQQAVERFQEQHHLPHTGVVDAQTWAGLSRSPESVTQNSGDVGLPLTAFRAQAEADQQQLRMMLQSQTAGSEQASRHQANTPATTQRSNGLELD